MTNLAYYAHLNAFGLPKHKESSFDYLKRYHAWMLENGYVNA